jgi:putative DNA primase/helicase
VSTVFGLDDENSNSEWSQKINPFIRDLRALGVAHIIQHHAGKNGELRGASAMDAMAHNKIRLKDHDSKMQGEAWFWVDNHGKQRAAGKTFQRFQIKFVSERGRTVWFEPEQDYISKKDKQALLQDLAEGVEVEKLAEDYGITKEEVMNVKSNFKRLFLLNENDEITASGREFLKKG